MLPSWSPSTGDSFLSPGVLSCPLSPRPTIADATLGRQWCLSNTSAGDGLSSLPDGSLQVCTLSSVQRTLTVTLHDKQRAFGRVLGGSETETRGRAQRTRRIKRRVFSPRVHGSAVFSYGYGDGKGHYADFGAVISFECLLFLEREMLRKTLGGKGTLSLVQELNERVNSERPECLLHHAKRTTCVRITVTFFIYKYMSSYKIFA